MVLENLFLLHNWRLRRMKKKEVILFILSLVFVTFWLIYCIMHPVTNYAEIPIEHRIRYEQRMIGW